MRWSPWFADVDSFDSFWTSAVDSETEKRIQVAIASLARDRTTIAIAHRLATLRDADFPVVVEDGKIV